MRFEKNHNLTDRALARIGQSVGVEVEAGLPEKIAQAEDAAVAEEKAQELVRMIEMELMGLSPTVTQLVLERIPDDLSVLPMFRGPARARKGIRRTDTGEDWPGGEFELLDYADPEKGLMTEEEATGVEQLLDMYSTIESNGVDGWVNAYEGDTWHINAIGEGLKSVGVSYGQVKKLVALLNEIQRAEFLDEDALASYESTLMKLSQRIIDDLNEYMRELAGEDLETIRGRKKAQADPSEIEEYIKEFIDNLEREIEQIVESLAPEEDYESEEAWYDARGYIRSTLYDAIRYLIPAGS